MQKILILLGTMAAGVAVAASCTEDGNALANKCDRTRCNHDSECESLNCEDGYCWSFQNRPLKCTTDPNALFYRCEGLICSRDVHCYDNECDNGLCVKGFTPQPTASCSEDKAALTNKCPFMSCSKDMECQSGECDDGVCETVKADFCSLNPLEKYNRCVGVACVTDSECQSVTCDAQSSLCIRKYHDDDDSDVLEIILTIVGVLILVGLIAWAVVFFRNKKLKKQLAEHKEPLVEPQST